MTTPLTALERSGPLGMSALVRAVGTSRSTVQRALSAAGAQVIAVGKGRSTTYAARRTIDGVQTPVPVWAIDGDGQATRALTLHPVAPIGYYIESHDPTVEPGFVETDPARPGPDPYADVPWFLLDSRPSGFLGRAWVKAHPHERFPADPDRWSGDHIIRWLVHHGIDLPGSWVVGAPAMGRIRHGERHRPPTALGDLQNTLGHRATLALAGWAGGSTPGGEQPKFTLECIAKDGVTTPYIVKFSPPMSTPAGRRWADLLLVEHLVHHILDERGIPSCESQIVDADDRRFLMVRRFDRAPCGGRLGTVSLAALDSAGVGADTRNWAAVTGPLVEDGRLGVAHHERVAWLMAFGHLIANSDMHPGNLSLALSGTRLVGVAPVYDMLPMFHAPRFGGEILPGLYDPFAEGVPLVDSARQAAKAAWRAVEADSRVSGGFKRIAAGQRERCG